jgi:uncharacterized protein YuzE
MLEKVNIKDENSVIDSGATETITISEKTDSSHYDFNLDTSEDESSIEIEELDQVTEKETLDGEWIDIDEPPELAYIPCANHNLQLCINDAFKKIKSNFTIFFRVFSNTKIIKKI